MRMEKFVINLSLCLSCEQASEQATSWILIDLIKMDTLFMMIDSPEAKSIRCGRGKSVGRRVDSLVWGCIGIILMRKFEISEGR